MGAKLIEKKDPTPVVRKPKICPSGKSKNIGTYLYGLPDYSEKLQKDIDHGKIILKCCIFSEDDPKFVRVDCKAEFYGILD